MMFEAFAINAILLALVVLIHYESLYHLTYQLATSKLPSRAKILFGVFGALFAHFVEVWVFAGAYYVLNHHSSFGTLGGNFDGSWWDCVYFSFTVYTTLGFGDITAHGLIRFLTGVESLAGMVLITWTASFLYLEMRRYWNLV
jgi:hypothetical protein